MYDHVRHPPETNHFTHLLYSAGNFSNRKRDTCSTYFIVANNKVSFLRLPKITPTIQYVQMLIQAMHMSPHTLSQDQTHYAIMQMSCLMRIQQEY